MKVWQMFGPKNPPEDCMSYEAKTNKVFFLLAFGSIKSFLLAW